MLHDPLAALSLSGTGLPRDDAALRLPRGHHVAVHVVGHRENMRGEGGVGRVGGVVYGHLGKREGGREGGRERGREAWIVYVILPCPRHESHLVEAGCDVQGSAALVVHHVNIRSCLDKQPSHLSVAIGCGYMKLQMRGRREGGREGGRE